MFCPASDEHRCDWKSPRFVLREQRTRTRAKAWLLSSFYPLVFISPCFQLSAALFQRGRERRSRDAELPPLPGRERQYAALNFVKLSRAQRGTLFLRFLGTFPPGRLTLGSSSNFSSFFLPSGAAVPAV